LGGRRLNKFTKMNKIKQNMYLFIAALSVLVACKDNELELISDKVQENPLKGKAKAIVTIDASSNKITTEWQYDATTLQLTGSKITDSLAKTTVAETFKRDTDGKIISISIEKTNTDGTKSQSEKTYKYNEKGQISSLTEALNGEQLIEDYGYDTDNKLIKYVRTSNKAGRVSNLQQINYTWKQNNVSSLIDRSLAGGYEEIDFQYNTGENFLAKYYKEELKINIIKPETISQNMLASSVKLFEGSRYKYEYEYGSENKMLGYKILVNSSGTWKTYSQVRFVYHE
jgi:hypothetical protein